MCRRERESESEEYNKQIAKICKQNNKRTHIYSFRVLVENKGIQEQIGSKIGRFAFK